MPHTPWSGNDSVPSNRLSSLWRLVGSSAKSLRHLGGGTARQRCHRLHGWPVAPRLLRSFLPSNEH
ncbi:MAG: hypothetical protein EB121_06565 [Alphaproteobacteria bacterium]|nr:hypothetical protein [Alphaproteobacteria bacterium]